MIGLVKMGVLDITARAKKRILIGLQVCPVQQYLVMIHNG